MGQEIIFTIFRKAKFLDSTPKSQSIKEKNWISWKLKSVEFQDTLLRKPNAIMRKYFQMMSVKELCQVCMKNNTSWKLNSIIKTGQKICIQALVRKTDKWVISEQDDVQPH